MKMIVISNSKGEIVGTVRGSSSKRGISEQGEMSAGLLPLPGQKFTEIQAPDEFCEYDAMELHERLKEFLSKRK